jgi:transposase
LQFLFVNFATVVRGFQRPEPSSVAMPTTGVQLLADVVLRSRPHPEQGFRACLGILRLARHYGVERLEAACKRGLEIGARSYGSINSILQNGLDRQPLARASPAPELPLDHPNIRGSRYYH